MISCEICEIFKNTFFCTTPFYSDCFCVFWKSGENFSPQHLRKSHVRMQQLYRELDCRHSRENFSKQCPQLFLLFSWALWNFELYLYLCSIVNNRQINNDVILSFQNMWISREISWRTETTFTKIKLSRNCKSANLFNLQNGSQQQAQISKTLCVHC